MSAAPTVAAAAPKVDPPEDEAPTIGSKFLELTVPNDAPSDRLENAFNASMVNSAVPLLSSWENYKESMPVRRFDGIEKYIRLRDVPFCASDDSIEMLAKQLENEVKAKSGIPTGTPRFAVAYLSARTRSGKTASIMSAFLNSHESNRERPFTHYLYVPFKNNARNNYGTSEDASTDKKTAERQGAAFMYVCIQALLDCKYKKPSMLDVIVENGPHRNIFQAAVSHLRQVFTVYTRHILRLPQSIPDVEDTSVRINHLLNKKIPGDHQRILIHLDEHRQMHTNVNFRRGAMTALAGCDRVKCMATFTEPLTEFGPVAKSSEVCRQPCTHVTFDLRSYLDKRYSVDIRRLVYGQNLELTSIQKRKWATLAFRMAAKVQVDLPQTLDLLDANGNIVQPMAWLRQIERVLVKFTSGKIPFNDALGQCLNVTAQEEFDGGHLHNKFTLDLMNGIPEYRFVRHFGNNSVGCSLTILNGNVVASWQDLLTLEYDDLVAFGDASQSFRDSLTEPDYLSGIPLEEAYGWSLLSRSAARGRLRFGVGFSFLIKANDYKTGRLFRTDTAELDQMVHPAQLKNGVLYRAAEGGNGVDHLKTSSTLNGVQAYKDAKAVAAAQKTTDEKKKEPRPNHPLCDFFFKSNDNELVMIDIAGGNDAEKKGKKLDDWIDEYGGRVTTAGILRIVGIVLAPFDKVAAVTEISGETSAIQPGIELPAGDSSDEEEEKREVVGLEEGDDERPPASEDGDEKSTHETPGDRNAGSGSATIYRKGKTDQVLLVRGRKAIDLLGALGQIAEWFNVSLGRPIDLAAEPPAGNDGEDQATQPAGPSGA